MSRGENSEGVLIVGADGVMGKALTDHLVRTGRTVLGTTRRPDALSNRRLLLDMTHDVSGWHPPGLLAAAVLCAAETSLERCRTETEASRLINVEHTVLLVEGGCEILT